LTVNPGDNPPSRLATPYLSVLEIRDAVLEVVLHGGLLLPNLVAAVMKGDLKNNLKNDLKNCIKDVDHARI
jgi:predicted cation transporter